jgi:peptide-methionine (S)-S-oxide reductase
MDSKIEVATFASGCFWCSEAVFKRIKGVKSVISGYSGGTTKNPTYDQVCSGETGHTESIQIEFDPSVISFEKLLDIFWHTHDPTTLNRQGNDVGTQYRSVIFYHNQNQKEIAEKSKNELEKSSVYKNPIVTEINRFNTFYPAEDYHADYYDKHPEMPYCSYVIEPKIHKLYQKYCKDLKESYQ